MFIRSEWTGNFQFHVSLLEKMLPYLAAAGHYKCTFTIKNVFKILKICILALASFIKKVLSTDPEMVSFSLVVLLLIRSLKKH